MTPAAHMSKRQFVGAFGGREERNLACGDKMDSRREKVDGSTPTQSKMWRRGVFPIAVFSDLAILGSL